MVGAHFRLERREWVEEGGVGVDIQQHTTGRVCVCVEKEGIF